MIRTNSRLRSSLRHRLESLETRSLMSLTATGEAFSGVVGKSTMAQIATFTDTDTTLMSTDLSASINWGDGTTSSGTVTSISGTNYEVNGVHTYTGFSTGSGYPVLVMIEDSKNVLSATANSTATISDSTLHAGNPIAAGTPQQFMGVGPTNVAATINSFQTAIGSPPNDPLDPSSVSINWDDVALDGTDDGGPPNTTVIAQGTTVGIPKDRYETEGIYFDSTYAVSNNSFSSVNANTSTLFPAYSGKNIVAPFNSNTIGLTFVARQGIAGTTPAAAAVKGFGAVFLNVEEADTTSIQYFDGDRSLGEFSVPVGTAGQPEFLGELFTNPVITRVQITLGTDALFSFNGVNFTAGTTADTPTTGHNLVAADDFDYAEPVPIANAGTVLNGAAGTSTAAPIAETVGVTAPAVVASFSSDNSGASPKNFTAEINWGDGHLTQGTVVLNSQGGFDVTGSNSYATAGSYPVTTTVTSFGGSTVTVTNTAVVIKAGASVVVSSSALSVLANQAVTLTATVSSSATSSTVPTGTIAFFDSTTLLGTVDVNAMGVASLSMTLSPGSHTIVAQYSGDNAYYASTSAPLPQSVNLDVTSLFGINLGGFKYRRGYVQRVTVKNNSAVAITGPIDLFLDNLASGVTLKNPSVTGPAYNGPYVVLPLGSSNSLAPGQTTYVDLVFAARRPRMISYTVRILAGLG